MFGEKLKELRKSKNITQEGLAQAIGVERSSIGKYEGIRKVVIPSKEILNQIADFFGVTIDYLFDDDSSLEKRINKLRLALNLPSKEILLVRPYIDDAFFTVEKDDEGISIINGLLFNNSIYLWCKYCQRWHSHGFPDKMIKQDHRRAHCDTSTPYKEKGYFINPILDLDEVLGNPLTELDISEYPVMAKYRQLDASGQEFIDMMIDREYQRSVQAKGKKEMHIPDMDNIRKEAEAFAETIQKQSKPTKI